MDGVPSNIATASYQTRIIVRDVTGKYTWDCAVLYGPEIPPQANGKLLIIAYLKPPGVNEILRGVIEPYEVLYVYIMLHILS